MFKYVIDGMQFLTIEYKATDRRRSDTIIF